jgi:DNA-binding NtrC family response regulator
MIYSKWAFSTRPNMDNYASPAVQPDNGGIIGDSAAMLQLRELIKKVGPTKSSVLILGETGTGKELVARYIHSMGLRCANKFVPVDCSALTPALVGSELFGHVKGAFTGADRSKQGLLQSANKGTLFFDEVGELPISVQAMLLRVLQERDIRPVGGTERTPINVRVIAATNRNLEDGIQKGEFRQDLYFRLNVVRIEVPALRDHKADIPSLVAHFLERFSDGLQPGRSLSDDALQRLLAYDWPGNVRELENAIECAMALSPHTILTADDLASLPSAASGLWDSTTNVVVPLADMERHAILRAVEDAGNDRGVAARLLGIGKTTLYRKLKIYANARCTEMRR